MGRIPDDLYHQVCSNISGAYDGYFYFGHFGLFFKLVVYQVNLGIPVRSVAARISALPGAYF
jgi:hypothetical protein